MSAIAGLYHLNSEPINLQHGELIMKSFRKFPADSIQVWNDEKVFFGCHNQWITPESVNETLPFYDYARQLAITADAIIDNREELFNRLQVEKLDRPYMTDSQLILLAYHKWGEETPKYLVGDFAFMIWDQKQRKFFGARDFSGSRTLYYFKNEDKIAFSTTIEPLLVLPFVEKRLNEEWLAEFLAISGMVDVVDTSITVYKNIEQLAPSHSISVTKDIVTLSRYCHLTSGKKLKLKTDEEYVEAFQDVFQDAVTSRLRTHKEVGAQLSGGLDSGAVVGFAAKPIRKTNKQLHTFSYIPPEDFKDFTPQNIMPDERPYIKYTVEHIGDIKDHYHDFNGRDSYSEIDDILNIMEMPYKFFENSFWLKGMFEKAQQEGIGILLNGGRGNLSISWGPAISYYASLLKSFKWIHLNNELDLYKYTHKTGKRQLIPYVAREALPVLDRFRSMETSYSIPPIIDSIFSKNKNVFNKLKQYGIDGTGWFTKLNIYEQRKRHFRDVYHWNASNTIAAKLSLRYSLWKRDPTNDLRVIRFCLSLPEHQYVQNGLDRALIRRSTKNYLPDTVRLNHSIRGVQGADWVHRIKPYWKEIIEEIRELLEDERVLNFLNGKLIKESFEKIGKNPQTEHATDPNYKILIRSLIVYRFIKQFN